MNLYMAASAAVKEKTKCLLTRNFRFACASAFRNSYSSFSFTSLCMKILLDI